MESLVEKGLRLTSGTVSVFVDALELIIWRQVMIRMFEKLEEALYGIVLHVLKFVSMEFRLFTIDFGPDGKLCLFATRYCVRCGKTERVTKRDEFLHHCGAPTKLVMEKKRFGLIRWFMVITGTNTNQFCRIRQSELVWKTFQNQLKENDSCMDHEGLTPIQAQIGNLLSEKRLYPFGKSDNDRSWAVTEGAYGALVEFFNNKMPNDGHMLFSDIFHVVTRTVKVMYNTEYEKRAGCDGHGLVSDSITKLSRQFRLLGCIRKSLGVLAKGLLVSVPSKQLGNIDIVVGSNCVKVGKDKLNNGDIFEGVVGLLNMDRVAGGRPGWEPIMFLKNVPAVHNFLNDLVEKEMRKLIEEVFTDRNALIKRFDKGLDEKEYPFWVQIIRSNIRIDKVVGKIITQVLLKQMADMVMGSGITSTLRSAKIDDAIPEEKLVCWALRVPFIGAKDALIRCTKDGWTTSKYMTDATGMDDDGDRINILPKDVGEFLHKFMYKIGKISLPKGYEVKRDESVPSPYNMIMKYLSQMEGPNIGIPCSILALDMAKGNIKSARMSASCAHYAAQLLKKGIYNKDGVKLSGTEILKLWNTSQYDKKESRDLDFARSWFKKEISDRLSAKKALSINHFALAIQKMYDGVGNLDKRYKNCIPYNPEVHLGTLNRRIADGCRIAVELYNEYDIQNRYNKPYKEASLTPEEAECINPIKTLWKESWNKINTMSRNGVHDDVLKGYRVNLREKMVAIGKNITDDVAKVIIKDALIRGRYDLADVVLPKSVGEYIGFHESLLDMDVDIDDSDDVEL